MNSDIVAIMEGRLPHVSENGFDALYGLELLELGPERARGRVRVRPELLQAAGLLHGGVYASIAESLASIATARVVVPQGRTAVGLANQTSFLRPVTSGYVEADAVLKHAGRTTWVWEVEMRDELGRLCVLTRMTIAVRDAPAA
jgi:uncharacterized protein (TIGR00369 family)